MLPPPDISISLVIPELIAAANSSRLLREVKAKASELAQDYFAEVVETISSSKVLEPSPISSSETS